MKATFAAGCFWHVEKIFDGVDGVKSTRVGYTGGRLPSPTYEQVCTDTTGHAEAVQVEYDPDMVSFDRLLQVFWDNHDPTTLNRQGPDVGAQYGSAIFYHDEEQKDLAEKSITSESKKYKDAIVTKVAAAVSFYDAEEYHQKYLEKHGM